MDKKDGYKSPGLPQEEEIGIDWVGYAIKLKQCWRFIAIVTFVAAFVGVIVALAQKRTYTVSVMLAPESQNKTGNSSLSSLTSMLGVSGASLNASSDALNITLFPEISQSVLFLTRLFNVEVIPYESQGGENMDPMPKPITLYKYITKEDEVPTLFMRLKESILGPEDFFGADTLNVSQLNRKQYQVVKLLRKSVSAEVNKKTGLVTISVTMDDPWIATTLADTVCIRLQKYVIAYRTQKAAEDLAYYERMTAEAKDKMIKAQREYALSVDFDRSVILQSINSEKERLQNEAQLAREIYNQMAQQAEMAKAKLQEVKPVFAVIEAATMPEFPDRSRKNIVLGFMFVGFCLAAGWKLFGEEYLASFKQQIKSKMEEEKDTIDPESSLS